MKKMNAFITVIIMFCAGTVTAQTHWSTDKEHSSIGFSVSHFGVSRPTGRFKVFDATVVSTRDDFSGAVVTFKAKTASVCTDNEERDHHLQSDAFFNTAKYPELSFTGKLIKEAGNKYLLKGNLTIRDITLPVSFAVTYNGRVKDSSFQMDKAGFTFTGSVSRLAYGLSWNETFQGGGPIIGNQVMLNINAELNKEE